MVAVRIDWNGNRRGEKQQRSCIKCFCGKHSGVNVEDPICKEFSLSEEMYGFATSIFDICIQKIDAHAFHINVEKILGNICNKFHKNMRAKSFSLNYQLPVAMQQMGCGNTDVATLSEFLGILTLGSPLSRHMWDVADEIKVHMDSANLKTRECKIDGHEHPPILMIKGAYGKYY